MAEVTLSPIPYGGGSLIATSQRQVFRLSGTKFVYLYGQANPNYTIAQIVDIQGIKTATPTITILRTQIIDITIPTTSGLAVHGGKMNSTDFVVAVDTTLNSRLAVFRADPTTNVITKVSNELTVSTRSFQYAQAYAGLLQNIKDNMVIEVNPNNGGTSLYRLEYNPGTSTLTQTLIVSTTGKPGGTFVSTSGTKSRDGTVWAFTSAYANTTSWSNGVSRQADIFFISADTGTQVHSALQQAALGNTGGTFLPSTAGNTGFFFYAANGYKFATGGTLGGTVVFTPNAVNNAATANWSAWLNQDYAILEAPLTSTQGPYLTQGRQFRVVRYVDDTFIEPTAGTTANISLFNTTGNILSPNAGSSREIFDVDTILLYGVNSTNHVIYVLHAPAA
jgi:hypothetical protein